MHLASQQAAVLNNPQLRPSSAAAKTINSNALQLAIESVQSGNAKLEAVANALWSYALTTADLNAVKDEIELYLQSNSISGSASIDAKAEAIVVTWKDVSGQSRTITISKNAEFGSLTLSSRAHSLLNDILPSLKAGEQAEKTAVGSFVLPVESMVAMGSLIVEVLASLELSLAADSLVTGDGLIYEISHNEELQKLLEKQINIDMQKLGQPADWLQRALAVRGKARQGIAAELSKEDQSALMKALLSIQPVYDLLVSLNATRVIDSRQAKPDTGLKNGNVKKSNFYNYIRGGFVEEKDLPITDLQKDTINMLAKQAGITINGLENISWKEAHRVETLLKIAPEPFKPRKES